jgi:MFS family permease
VGVAISTVANSTIGSSLASEATQAIGEHFNITNSQQLVLPTSIYLVGYIIAPFIWGPLSESYGRKGVMLIAFFMFTIFTMACALANSFVSFIIFRLLAGAAGACPIAVVGGICAGKARLLHLPQFCNH